MREVTTKNLRCTIDACPALFEVTPAEMVCSVGMSCPALFEVTPQAEKCTYMASCPAVFEVTPPAEKCAVQASCPAIFEKEDGVLIIGKRVAIPEEIKDRVGPDEGVLWVPKGLLKNIEWKKEKNMTQYQPLPVAGYTPQPEENVALVNEGKEIQERVLRYLDKIASVAVQREEHGREFGKGKIGMRELALGRTNIETGFMWAFRSVFNPTRIALPEDAIPAESSMFPPRPE